VNAAEAAMENGANSVTAVATHAILSDPAVERISQSSIKKLIVTDTLAIPDSKKIRQYGNCNSGTGFWRSNPTCV